MQNPTIKEIVTSMRIPDVAQHFSLKEYPEAAEKRLNIWASKSRRKYKYDDDILMTALLLGMRTKKDHDIPNEPYLNAILENFKKFHVETVDDAINQFVARVKYELDKLETSKEVKKHFQNKNILEKIKLKRI